MLALEGVDRKAAAQTCGMDRQTLRDWVHRYNAEGLAGLSNRRGAPRSRRLDAGQLGELVSWLEAGPDPAVDGVVRWRRQDLQRRITDRFGVELHERTVGKYLAALGYRRLSVRPAPSKDRPRGPGGFQKNFADVVAAAVPEAARGKPLEVWFQCMVRLRYARRNADPRQTLLQRIRLVRGHLLPQPQWEPLECVPYKTTRFSDLLPPSGLTHPAARILSTGTIRLRTRSDPRRHRFLLASHSAVCLRRRSAERAHFWRAPPRRSVPPCWRLRPRSCWCACRARPNGP